MHIGGYPEQFILLVVFSDSSVLSEIIFLRVVFLWCFKPS